MNTQSKLREGQELTLSIGSQRGTFTITQVWDFSGVPLYGLVKSSQGGELPLCFWIPCVILEAFSAAPVCEMLLPHDDNYGPCPMCGTLPNRASWVNATCPDCGHCNAILGGVCRDCNAKHPELEKVVEYYCATCLQNFIPGMQS